MSSLYKKSATLKSDSNMYRANKLNKIPDVKERCIYLYTYIMTYDELNANVLNMTSPKLTLSVVRKDKKHQLKYIYVPV